ncbi:hypothetical protein [Mesorhizobium sp. J8]|uniref:hypothetical protein n=1 Tax=Mesorhizobium sp. J8 TaxID=2777475 RepID=UPI001915EB03|nr:hypothetical protein [Mesorhizobium sp. J8]BCM19258.1 hypothetical protein MJ8_30310 [Mesorhizobium sp. J8]
MPVENTTPNRGYQLPFGSNNLEDDVLRLIAALSAIDVDVAGLLVSVAQRALLVHSHVIADTTGLQAALDAKQDESEKGNANGYASLGADGKVPAAQLPSTLFGSLNYQGDWNANTNSPTIPAAAAGNKGWYYMVSVAGAASVGGITDWKVGDWAVSDGTKWVKIDNTDAVASVAGLTGAITAAALKTALAIAVADLTDASANGRSLISAANYAAMKTLLGITAADITNASANGRSLITAADYAAMRTLLGLVIGTNVAAIASPAFTGTPTAPTPAAGDNSTKIATTAFVAGQSGIASATVQAASGTAITFTGIPAGVKEITIMARGISFAAAGSLKMRVGPAAGLVTTGYEGGYGLFQSASNAFAVTDAMFAGQTNNSGDSVMCFGKLFLMDAVNNVWGWSATGYSPGRNAFVLASAIALSGPLSQISFFESAGSSFDAGTLNIAWSK